MKHFKCFAFFIFPYQIKDFPMPLVSLAAACIGLRPFDHLNSDTGAAAASTTLFPKLSFSESKKIRTEQELARRDLRVRTVPQDGNGLFYAVLDQMAQRQIGWRSNTGETEKVLEQSSPEKRKQQAVQLRSQLIDFLKCNAVKGFLKEFGTPDSNALKVADFGYCKSHYNDELLVKTALSHMLNINLITLKKEVAHCANGAAMARRETQLIIVKDYGSKYPHFNSTEPVASAKSASTLPDGRADQEAARISKDEAEETQVSDIGTRSNPVDRQRYDEALANWEKQLSL